MSKANMNYILSVYSNLQLKGVEVIKELYETNKVDDKHILVGGKQVEALGLNKDNLQSFVVPSPIYKYSYRDLDGRVIHKGELRYQEILNAMKLGLIFSEPVLDNYVGIDIYSVDKDSVNRYEFQIDKVISELKLESVEALYKFLESSDYKISGLRKIIKKEEEIELNEIEDTLDVLNTLSDIYNRDWAVDLFEEQSEYKFRLHYNCLEAFKIYRLLKRGSKS